MELKKKKTKQKRKNKRTKENKTRPDNKSGGFESTKKIKKKQTITSVTPMEDFFCLTNKNKHSNDNVVIIYGISK